jgi:hypothetical protein
MSAPTGFPIILPEVTAVGSTSILLYLFVGHITGAPPLSYFVLWGTSPTSQINKIAAITLSATQYFVRIDFLEPNTTYYVKTVCSGSVSPDKESPVVSYKTATFSGFEILPNFFFAAGSAISVRNNRISPRTILHYCYQGRIRANPDENTNFFAECRQFELGELHTTREGLGDDNGMLANRYTEIINNINQIRKYINTNSPGQGRGGAKAGKEVMFIQDISSDQVSRETICFSLKLGPETITPLYQRKSVTYIDNKTDFIISEAQDRLLCIKPQI